MCFEVHFLRTNETGLLNFLFDFVKNGKVITNMSSKNLNDYVLVSVFLLFK